MFQTSETFESNLTINSISKPDFIKQYASHIVREIKSFSDWDAEVEIHIEPEAIDKNLYSVSIAVSGLDQNIIIQKEGKNIIATLRKVRRAVIRKVHELSRKRVSLRRKNPFRLHVAE